MNVEVVVDFVSAGTVYCTAGGAMGLNFPTGYDGVTLIRRKFEVGEDVIFRDPDRTKHHATILALHDESAWVKLPSGKAVTARIRDLEVIEPIKVDAPAVPIPGGNGTWVPAPADPLDPGPQLDDAFQPIIDKTVELAKAHGIDPEDPTQAPINF